MKLKRLELIGFKSFAQKTSLEFLPGIIGIVGPNGSGKSNITDAIRWILGERESSHLRSAKIEDLIFAGTPARPPMSLAQVSMHFDNSAGVLPIDYSDVAVSRKIGRDGVSEYYLNDSRVRLRDITDLFAKARLGVRGIAVINQGASDVFLRAKPDERREMIEEMLGLKEYRLKKNDAENKLKNTDVNLSKGKALLEEIQPHLRFLRRQVTRWNKRSEIEGELKTLEKDYFLRQLKAIRESLSGISGRREQLESLHREKKSLFQERRAKLEKSESNQPELLERLSRLRLTKNELESKKGNLVRALGKLEGRLEAAAEVAAVVPPGFNPGEAKRLIHELRAEIERMIGIGDVGAMQEAARMLLSRIDSFIRPAVVTSQPSAEKSARIEAIEKERAGLIESVTELEKSLSEVIAEEAEISAQASETNKTFQSAFRSSEEASDELRRIERGVDEVRLDEERISVHREDLKTRVREAGWNFEELENAFEGYQFLPDDAGMEDRIFKLRREIGAVGDIDQALLNEANEVENRNTFLTTEITDLEAARIDLEKLIVDLDGQIHEIFSGSLKKINEEFQNFFRLMFGGGKAKLVLDTMPAKKRISALDMIGSEIGGDGEEAAAVEDETEQVPESEAGIEITIDLPRKKIKSVEMLSGGERSLISIAALFALVAVSPPPFLVLDEVDAALDEMNARRFSNLLKDLSKKTQFIVVTHNRVTMEATDALYGVTMGDDGISKVLSLKLEESGPVPATV